MRIDGRHDHLISSSKDLALCLRRLRKGMLITQGDIAFILDMGQPRYSRIEARPGAVNLSLLLEVLELLEAKLLVVPEPVSWEEAKEARALALRSRKAFARARVFREADVK